jgi:hypothetical protein
MQKCITAGAGDQKRNLMKCVASNTPIFVKDPFANYVVQFVLELRDAGVNHMIG